MVKEPLVSIIVIFLNEEQYIQEAIDSVFAQTYEHWELLLVDDGSTDNSTAIARRYAQEYPAKVRYLEHEGHENRGMSATRNLGVRHAKGKYISYLDGDDVWLPRKLEQQVAILETQPETDMVYAPLLMWYSWTGRPEDLHRDHLYSVKENVAHPYANTLVRPPNLLTLFLRYEQFIPSGFLLKREVLERVGAYEEQFRDAYSDAVALVKICLTATVFVSSEVWYKYRKHEKSFTYISWLEDTGDAEQLFYLNWVEAYFHNQGVTDPGVWQVLRLMLYPYRYPKLYSLRQRAVRYLRRISPAYYAWLRVQWRRFQNAPSVLGPNI